MQRSKTSGTIFAPGTTRHVSSILLRTLVASTAAPWVV